jgi:hypothetical protein
MTSCSLGFAFKGVNTLCKRLEELAEDSMVVKHISSSSAKSRDDGEQYSRSRPEIFRTLLVDQVPLEINP